jgi:hypothetical protein
MSWWRKGTRGRSPRPRRPLRQYWSRRPTPTDALAGYVPGLGLVDEDSPAEVFSDEIDPAWADENSETGEEHGQVT